MKKRILSILLFGVVFSCALAMAQDVVVIVNNGVKATAASKDDIAGVFTGDKSSLGDGSKVTPVTLKGGAAHEAFLRNYIGKSDAAYRTAWRSLVFTGQGSMPKSFDSEAALVDYVAATPGSIGYVSSATGHDKVKTLTIK
jgi:ABC-type phosphate transport system substrate-binding protein